MGFLKGILVLVALSYLGICAALFVFQNKALFHPQTDRVAPTEDYIEAVEITTADDETLVAWYSQAESGCPTTLFFHGNGGRIDLDRWRYQRLRDKGVGFLVVGWRGYAGSSGKPSEAGLHKDAEASWRWLLNKGLQPKEIIIHGFSLGSGPATKLASREGEGMLILEAPYYSMEDLVSRKLPIFPVGMLLQHKFRSDLFITDTGSPVMMAHGTADRLIPINQSRRLFELAPEPKAYFTLEGSDHNELVRDGLYDSVWPFIAANWDAPVVPTQPTNCYLNQFSQEEAAP